MTHLLLGGDGTQDIEFCGALGRASDCEDASGDRTEGDQRK